MKADGKRTVSGYPNLGPLATVAVSLKQPPVAPDKPRTDNRPDFLKDVVRWKP